MFLVFIYYIIHLEYLFSRLFNIPDMPMIGRQYRACRVSSSQTQNLLTVLMVQYLNEPRNNLLHAIALF